MWIPRTIKSTQNFISSKRTIFAALNYIFNKVSPERIKEVGPDRACAEWLMRNGAFVRWVGNPAFVMHYDNLPLNPKETGPYLIEEIRAADASISHYGFDHFCGCNHITTISLHKCHYLNDKALAKLIYVKDSLCDLEIVDCNDVTADGISTLSRLTALKVLTLGRLGNKKNNLDSVVQSIATALPNCQIIVC